MLLIRSLVFSALVALVVLSSYSANAATGSRLAQQTSGSISGRVKNAVTGMYLNRARISIKGTDLQTYTDEYGSYRLPLVPNGPVVLEVFYTDLDPQEISLELSTGEKMERDIALTSAARYGASADVTKLDPFVVASNKETDAQAIATNEQRFAPNIKNVIAADAFGEVFGNSAGDFLKFLPGVVADYDNAEVSGISVRGIGSEKTTVMFDGAPIVTGDNSGPTRAVEMRTQALNNVSRVDVTKVPTPAMPADTLGGAVNLISKNAFERSGAQLRFGINLNTTDKTWSLQRTPQPYEDKLSYKILPGFDFDYTLPVGKNFGIVLTGMYTQKYQHQNIGRETWNNAGTGTGASLENPFLQSFFINDAPRFTDKSVYSLKADWRVAPNSVITFGTRWGRNVQARTGFTQVTPNAGTNGAPTPATGTRLSFGPDFTLGATGRGAVNVSGASQYSVAYMRSANLAYRFDDGKWRVDLTTSYSDGESYITTDEDDAIATISAVLREPSRVTFREITPERPGVIEVFNNANQPIDMLNPANYRLSTAARGERTHIVDNKYANLDLQRRIEKFSFPFSVQLGGQYRVQTKDAERTSEVLTFTGADDRIEPFLNSVYRNREIFLGFENLPGMSPHKAWQAYKVNPGLFTMTPAQAVTAENFRLNSSQFAEEKISAFYTQGEARLFKGRLNVLAGLRYERTTDYGEGLLFDPTAVFMRNADGTFAHNAQGTRIRLAAAGAAGSMEETRLTRRERDYTATRSYDGYYPSVHVTHSLQENLQVRLAWARTFGRPDFPDIIPTATIQEADLSAGELNDPSIARGDITVTNTGLKPWTANNYDLSIEYYTQQGGTLSAGVFRKDISDFFGDKVVIATEADLAALDLDPRYLGWNLTTKFNSGDARISGVELSVQQSLRSFGTWGRHFTVFANATKLKLRGDPHASFASFVPEVANWGVQFNWKKFTVMPRWNYRGKNKLIPQPAFGPDGYSYIDKRLILDLSMSYQLSSRLSLVGSVSNLTNDPLTQLRYGSTTPAYARRFQSGEYGASVSIGIKGRY